MRALAFVVGLAGVVLAVASSRVDAGTSAPSARVTLSVNRTGELDVAPAGTVISASDLRPGARRQVTLRVRNQSGVPVALRLRARGRSRALDDALALVVRASGRTLADGSLSGLRQWTPPALVLGPGRATRLTLDATLTRVPSAPAPDDDVTVELRARAREPVR